ncbi:GTP-binding protein At2g22870-like [Chenopodium quinoa]|uniref:GTP-binding protein At2g22870-like n=1 Tax=Chenopodium quinoa TaxID=63459 RepID=UPI000B7749EE|nr:GTP-binding protein At2g22870-like [Chenopodium quinoa]
MAKEFAKSSKISLKFKGRSSKNGDNNGEFDKQEKGKKGFSKKFTKEKTHIRSNPLKVSSLESSKKKFGEKKKKFEDFSGKSSKNLGNNFDKQPNNDDNKYIRKNPLKFSSSESGKNKFGDNRNKFEENSSNVSILRTERKKFGKKNSEDDSVEAKPKKKKRVIKIDCYDFSNKRLDDGNVLNEITNQQKKKEEKKEEVDKVELSMNAQFRAIKPSPSILTFVEDNLLGRRRDIELRRVGYNTELSAPLDNIPFSTSTDRERIEESVFRNKMEFFAAAKVSSSFPPPDLPEIAFAGRSNVGKSSLLNSLTRQWGVVRTSDKPGHTQSINFFNLGTKLNLVDLPGYGFAYAKEEVKEAWEDLVKEYVSTRIGLKRVCLLIDTKWGMKPRDHELVHLMERYQTKYQIVLTKTDTVFPLDVARRAMQIEETLKEHRSIVQPVMMVSSRSGAGIRCLRTALSKIAQFVKP